VHHVLNNLLRERVPIRDLETILQTLGDYADRIKDVNILTEYVRTSLARTICQQYRDKDRVLRVVTLDPTLEDVLAAGFDFGEHGLVVKLSPQLAEAFTSGLARRLESLVASRRHPVVLVSSPALRAGLRQVTSGVLPRLAVLSLNEITRDTQVESVAQVGAEALPRAAVGVT
jgi:flagellar biosynthesis protein FlhA